MTRTIHKYPVDVSREPKTFKIPYGAELVHFGPDPADQTCLWVEIDTDKLPVGELTIQVFGTGWPIPEGRQHFMSTMVGGYVWHCYVVM